jgi:hypothetical protein
VTSWIVKLYFREQRDISPVTGNRRRYYLKCQNTDYAGLFPFILVSEHFTETRLPKQYSQRRGWLHDSKTWLVIIFWSICFVLSVASRFAFSWLGKSSELVWSGMALYEGGLESPNKRCSVIPEVTENMDTEERSSSSDSSSISSDSDCRKLSLFE